MDTERMWQLLAKRMSSELSPEESIELDQWLANSDMPAHELLTGIPDLKVAGADDAGRKKSLAAIKARIAAENIKPLRILPVRWMAAAAVALLLVTTGIWYFISGSNKPAEEMAFIEVSTIGGARKQLALADGTLITLNSESKLRYNKDFGKTAREIFLDGEAYFEVEKNAGMPLMVYTAKADVMVTGTVFNVKAYPGDALMEASLIQGAIALLPHAETAKKIILKPGEKFTMGNKKEIAVNQAKLYEAVTGQELMQVTKIKALPKDTLVAENAWIADKMVFDAEPFSQVARRMERWYHIKVVINDPALAMLPLSGNFEKENLQQALEALRGITPFEYTMGDNEVVISR